MSKVLVLCGGDAAYRQRVVDDMVGAGVARVHHFNLSGRFRSQRADHAMRDMMFNSSKLGHDEILLFSGVCEPNDIDVFRQVNASFAHVRGPLAKPFNTTEVIKKSDFHVVPARCRKKKPDGVLRPSEVLTEILTRGRHQ